MRLHTGVCGHRRRVRTESSLWEKNTLLVVSLKSTGLVIERLGVRIPAGAAGDFLLQSQLCVLTLIRCPFHPHVTAVARKRPRSFCQKCRWQVTPKEEACNFEPTKSKWANCAAVQAECGNLSGNERTRNSSGNTRSQSSQLAGPL